MATDYTNKQKSDTYSEGITSDKLSLRPKILEVIGNISGKKILDLGCGSGKYSIIFARMGAHVTGIDISTEQIKNAEEISSHKNIEYLQGNAEEILKNKEFDIVFMNMVVPDIGDPEKLKDLFVFAYKAVKNSFIFTALHPLYLCPKANQLDAPKSDFDPKDYFNEGSTFLSKAQTDVGNEMHFNETHYSLTFVSKLLSESGFVIKRLVESAPVPKEDIYFPIYLIFECVKKD